MDSADVAIVGGGAAGLAAAIFAARRRPGCAVVILDGAKRLGAKILVSGGGRCNVTNRVVTADDFNGGSRNSIRRVLQHFSVEDTVAFFHEIGVNLHEEENGKLFPDTNSARTVLDALLTEASRRGVRICAPRRVQAVQSTDGGFHLETSAGPIHATRLVLATGGESLPKTGSDGAGYALARSLGHGFVPTAPALVPLLLEGSFHRSLSGITHDAELGVHIRGEKVRRLRGSMLWTHFGVSGPLILNASGPWHRAGLAGREVALTLNFVPGTAFVTLERRMIDAATKQPRTALHNALPETIPARLREAIPSALSLSPSLPLAHLTREQRRLVVRALTEWKLPVRGSRGYQYAEVTSGGVPLDEIDPASLASRCCRGLYLAGEILDVDGRIGGFNFQWAWASGRRAGEAAAEPEGP